MLSYSAEDILDKIEQTDRNGMSVFYAMLLMIIVVTIVGATNFFSMGIRVKGRNTKQDKCYREENSRWMKKNSFIHRIF